MAEKKQPAAFLPNVVYEIDLDKIRVSPFPPQKRRRAKFKTEALTALGDSIKTHGLAQPIVVRIVNRPEPFEIVFGERRFLGSELAGLKTILAFVRDLDDKSVLELQYEENHRQQQNDPLDDAFFFSYLIDKENYTEETLADRFNKTKREITDALKLNDLIAEAREELSNGALPLKHAFYLARFPAETQAEIVHTQLAYKYHDREEKAVSFEIFKDEVESEIVRRLGSAPFPTDDPRLHHRHLLCRDCPDNSAFATHLFPEFAGEARCLNKSCFEVKTNTYLRLTRESIAAARPNPNDAPIEEIAADVPIVTERKYVQDRVPFEEKVLTDQKLLDRAECEFSEISLAVEGAKKGRQVYICRNERCPVHHPPPEYDEDDLTEREKDFDERVAMRVRLKVLKQAMAFFDDRKTLWQFDDLIKNLIVEFISNINPDFHADILWTIRNWENAPKNFKDKDRLRAFVGGLDKRRQSQILFLLSVVGTEDLEVLKISKGYAPVNFFLLDAETRLEMAPTEFKTVATEYLEAVRAGRICDVPRFWQNRDFDDVPEVSSKAQ